jgi:signal transduction histidine kinase/ActR/RegA family two-component response regulator
MIEVEGPEHIACFVNPAFCRLLKRSREEIVGKPFAELARHGDKCVPFLNRVYKTGEFETNVQPDESKLEPAYWLYAMWPAFDSNAKPERVVIKLTRTVHSLKNVEAVNEALMISAVTQHELRHAAEQSNARLQAEIADRVVAGQALVTAIDALKVAQIAAERGSRAKDDFLAALSHELRTPLTPVLLTAAALREDLRLPADVRELLVMIERNIALEARLIDDLLDLTKISKGKLEYRPAPCEAHQLIMFAVEIVRDDARAKNIAITCDLTAEKSALIADATRFEQVIWNLLRNAIKFTPSGGKIAVSSYNRTETAGGTWLGIAIVDTGIGIDPERLEQIFQPFEQGGLTGDHRFGGMGLGLAIAKAVVNMHGGRIAAQSAGRNRGATLTVELPGANSAFPAVSRPGVRAPSTVLPGDSHIQKPAERISPLRLLVVEDHENTRQTLRWLLEHDGHHVRVAGTIAEAQAAAEAEKFDLVISDLGLPDGTGYELMRSLRAEFGLRGIALSGYGMDEDVTRSYESGFIAHLTKPMVIAELRRVIVEVGRGEKT